MPQIGGPKLVKQHRQVQRDFKVLCVSIYTDSNITNRGELERGMNYVQKPFTHGWLKARSQGPAS